MLTSVSPTASRPVLGLYCAGHLASSAVQALLAEVRLTPKPGLVDTANNGCHHDLTLALMEASAEALFDTFFEMGLAAWQVPPSQALREQLAAIGRDGEQQMLRVTGGVNTHKGAIWALGLLVAATASCTASAHAPTPRQVLVTAGAIASFDDRYLPPARLTHGQQAQARYGVRSAREEAQAGFPALRDVALPAWEAHAAADVPTRQLLVLLALMAAVDDTCVLHRSSLPVLREVQRLAGVALAAGGGGTFLGGGALAALDDYLTQHWISPGGSADLLAATLFLHQPAYIF
jgi:triphosphoribosyl-dephospho-CoA synthase